MDHITVYDGDTLTYEYGESELMRCGSKVFELLDVFYRCAPRVVVACFDAWSISSSLEGTNPSLTVEYNGMRYIFTNHYWD